MHFANFILQEVRAVGKELGIEPVVIQGEECRKRGFGGTFTILQTITP